VTNKVFHRAPHLEDTGRFLAFRPLLRKLQKVSAATFGATEPQSNSMTIGAAKSLYWQASVSSSTDPALSVLCYGSNLDHGKKPINTPQKIASSLTTGSTMMVDCLRFNDPLVHSFYGVDYKLIDPPADFDAVELSCRLRTFLASGTAAPFRSLELASPEKSVKDYLRANSALSEACINNLTIEIRRCFPEAELSLKVVTDPEEGWNKLVISVITKEDDLDRRVVLEDKFYSRVDDDVRLGETMRYVVVSFR
jgi:hypothetical protein